MPEGTTDLIILGQRFRLRHSDGDPELSDEVLKLVSGRLEAAEARVKESVVTNVTLLALLDLAEEYVRSKRRVAEYQAEIQERAEAVVREAESPSGRRE